MIELLLMGGNLSKGGSYLSCDICMDTRPNYGVAPVQAQAKLWGGTRPGSHVCIHLLAAGTL